MQQLDLCSGVGGGFCLAGMQAGWELVGVADNNEFCSDILSKRFPSIHNYGDVRSLAEQIRVGRQPIVGREIDVITASPPCPPFSINGQRLGASDERDCFPAILETFRELQPRFAVFENVSGLLNCPYRPDTNNLYFSYLLRQLALSGYDAEWITITSGHFSAPFLRERLLLVAVSQRLIIEWERAASWADQARGRLKELQIASERRGVKPGYPLRVVQSPGDLVRPLGVKSRNGIIRKQRQALGNLLDPRVAAVAVARVQYLNSIAAAREQAAV
ncbi:DNA cytosine methyltransferase [Cylindrospermum stagnale]|uniref:DNA cytosine methyltransferase n=1 Tax=Cylindrospermum stagnale TaxID=142864 RepID=UPI000A2F8A40